ncbi:ABC transporter permease [Alicyclobacillus tolerans]|uniref:ABC transporter permease n=1 Tax=Alicyclobacillus tolerans TaxID=90970 RepID=UPI001F1AABC0|nr:ABC transporter permease [Alicyclobacillus tolerans]MCF8565732.1 ABC transporter permease [Alicyclobacillus tolerans]
MEQATSPTTVPLQRSGTSAVVKTFSRAVRIPGLVIGGTLFVVLVVCAVLAPVITPGNPNAMNFGAMLHPPSMQHPFGTDNFGRGIFRRELYGLRLSMIIGLLVASITGVIGTVFGVMAGLSRRADAIIMRVADGFMAFPWMVLAIASMAFLGSSTMNVIIVLSIVYSPRMARIVRSAVLVEREREYIVAENIIGASPWRIVMKHLLPNILAPIIVQLTFTFAYAVLNESLLDFLGVGVPPSVPSLGKMISDSQEYMVQAPWMTIFPGVGIAVTVITLNLLGDGIQDFLGVKSSQS